MKRCSALGFLLFCTLFPAGFLLLNRDKRKQCSQDEARQLNSFLWTIKRPAPQPPSYLFGTIHVPYTRVWDFVPESSKRAFQSSTSVFFELDLTDPVTVSKLASCQLLPNGESLRSLLPRDIYLRLKRHLDYVRHMMPAWVRAEQRFYADYLFKAIAGDWERKRPVWVMLMVNSLTEWDVRWRGAPVLDLFLAREAERMGKKTGAVEDVEEQCHPLNGLSFSQVLFALNQTLRQHEGVREGSVQGPFTTEDLITHYNCGDLSAIIFNHDSSQLPHFLNSSLLDHERSTAQQIDSYLRQELIYKRNERMAHRVSTILQRSPSQSFFFAFGAGHFLGNHSVLDILRQEGYEVEHTPAQEPAATLSWNGEMEGTTVTQSGVSPEPVTEGTSEPPEVDEELPHLLEPDSLSQLEEFGRHQRPRKAQRPHSRQRLFSDLWVRIGYSTTSLPNVQRTNDYVTTRTSLKLQEDQHRRRSWLSNRKETPPPSLKGLATPSSESTLPFIFTCLLTQVLLLFLS
ncbi:metalloprotease TIKI2 isoform X1 [Neoarius graeffei]|uniref:metalloprotease TIKI2 isoform X1 n=1 Tax=Neoarius graeffei TaxID=443677 RepID=UPI00298CB92B|nr:metalloprotease TIKI2 isoform X1 [Neoarius graeffei]